MANEGKLTLRWVVVKGNQRDDFNPGTLQRDVTVNGKDGAVFSITTSESNPSLAALTKPGMIILQSLEPTTGGYVEYGHTTGAGAHKLGKLVGQDIHVFRMSTGATLRMVASAGTIKVNVMSWEAT